jgi:uncharacterized protein (TIGR02145 family)
MRALLLFTTFALALTASAQVPDYVPTDGLVAWYPFNGDATDASGNGHDGTVEGAILATDRFSNSNGAYYFNGDDRIFPANPEGYPLQERTTSIWMKSNVPVTGGRTLMGYGGSSCGNSWFLTYNNLGNQPYTSNAFEIQGHCNNNSVAAPLPPGEFTNWHLVVVRTSAAGTDVLIDGVLGEHSSVFIDDTAPGCAVFGATPSTSGGCYFQDSNNALWNGWLDDIGIWNRALSDEEIAGLYNAPPPIAGCTDPDACNPDPNANLDDGSCKYGCLYCGAGTIWNPTLETCVAAPPELDTSGNCTLLNLQELAEGYLILLAQNAELDSLLADCNGTSTSDQPSPCAGENVVTYHGYDYDIVEIGDQCWFAENLQTERYVNGDLLEGNLSDGEWSSTASGAQAVRNNDDSNLPSRGRLYNWFAVVDTRGLCPSGWHAPTDAEWMTLEVQLGMPQSEVEADGSRGTAEGQALKSSASDSPPWNGNNSAGFNAFPGGKRSDGGSYSYGTTDCLIWTSSTLDGNSAWLRDLDGDSHIERYAYPYRHGFSVRCVKD